MTIDIAPHDSDLSTLTLDELASTAVDEYRAASAHLAASLDHFIRLGEVMIVVYGRMQTTEEWRAWLDHVGIGTTVASQAARLATYKDQLPPEAFLPYRSQKNELRFPTHTSALTYIVGLPPISNRRRRTDPAVVGEAIRLREAGLPYEEIAQLLNVSTTAVRDWCNPEAYKSRNRRRAKARALAQRQRYAADRALAEKREREERDRLAVTTGGELAKAYAVIRAALKHLDLNRGPDDAIRALHRAEEAVVATMRGTT